MRDRQIGVLLSIVAPSLKVDGCYLIVRDQTGGFFAVVDPSLEVDGCCLVGGKSGRNFKFVKVVKIKNSNSFPSLGHHVFKVKGII